MKIRNSFVTNSSSSSFILLSKKDLPSIKLTIDIELNESRIIKTEKDLLEFFDYYYCSQPNDKYWEEYKEEYEDMLSKINEGNIFYMGYASNESDNPIEQFIYYNGLSLVKFEDGIEVYRSKY